LNNLYPIIEIEQSTVSVKTTLIVVAISTAFIIYFLVQSDYLPCFVLAIITLFVLALMNLMKAFGIAIFRGELIDEINIQ